MRQNWVWVCLFVLMLAGCHSNVTPVAGTAENVSKVEAVPQPEAPELATLPQAPADPEVAAKLSARIDQVMTDYDVPGVAIGVFADDKVVYAHCSGKTSIDSTGKPITPKTLFNIHPRKRLPESDGHWVATAESFRQAGLPAIEGVPGGDFARPHGRSANDETVALPSNVIAEDAVWASLDGMMSYLSGHSDGIGLSRDAYFSDDFFIDFPGMNEIQSNCHEAAGYSVSVYTMPLKGLRIVFLANTNEASETRIVARVISAILGQEYEGLTDAVEAYEAMMNGGSMHSMYGLFSAKKSANIIGTYHNDEFGDIRIIAEGDGVVVESAFWRSRLGTATDFDISMEREVDKEEAERIAKTHPEYILVTADDGSAVINETMYTSLILYDAPVTFELVEFEYADDNDPKADSVRLMDRRFERVK